MRFLRHDMHSLSGAYALDAIESGSELDRFTRHMSRCASCASEVRGFREVATALAFAATAEPPPELRDRVLTAAARTRQLPPEVRTHARPRRTRAWPHNTPWVPWISGVVATASIVVAVLFGFAQAHTQQQLTLAYYGGYSYRQVSELLKVTLGAIKTRIRDGLIRMRDCLGRAECGSSATTCTRSPVPTRSTRSRVGPSSTVSPVT